MDTEGQISTLFQKHDMLSRRVGELEKQQAVTNDRLDHISGAVGGVDRAISEWKGQMTASYSDLNSKIDQALETKYKHDGALVFGKWVLGTLLAIATLIVAYKAAFG